MKSTSSPKLCSVVLGLSALSLFGVDSFRVGSRLYAADPDYARDVKPLLTKYCVGCHGDKDNESEVQLQSFALIMKGAPDGPIVTPKHPEQSKLLQLMLGTTNPKMPPEDSPQMTNADIEVVRNWIELGAAGSDDPIPLKSKLRVKKLPSQYDGPLPITSLGRLGDHQLLVGRFDHVHRKQNQWSEALPIDVVGKVSQVRTTSDGRFTVLASGVPGVGGQATVLQLDPSSSVPKLVRVIESHTDTLYTAVLSPDGTILATAGYDRVAMLWNMSDGTLLRKLEGHNGAIYDLDFDATGQIIASASADETIKIWRVDTGERLDTLGQCEAEQYAVRFDSPRNRVIAAGADRRIRVWKIVAMDKPSVSPMLYSIFAHDGSVNYLALTRDRNFLATAGEDKLVKLWSAEDMTPLGQIGTLDDAPTGLDWDDDQRTLAASTMAGRLLRFDASSQMNVASASLPSKGNLSTLLPLMPTASSPPLALEEHVGRHSVATAQELPGACVVSGVLTNDDMEGEYAGDWYSLQTKAGDPWVIQMEASRIGSPMDSLLDITDAKGNPIVRTRLQAVRESYFTFRGKDSTNVDDFRLHRWEDMELNEMLYAGGEVVKLWLYPRGPDSGFKVYPGAGTRFTYFDTTATTHALNESAWIVRELADGETPIANGLPIFPIYYSNDDQSSRLLGKDSQITFSSKLDGKVLIRVRDSRGQSGDQYKYKLEVRKPNPKIKFRVEQKEITLRPGVGTEFEVAVDRFEGCDAPVHVNVQGIPEGVSISSPLIIQAGQSRAVGSLFLPTELAATMKEFTVDLSSQTVFQDREISGGDPIKLTVKTANKPALKSKIVAKDQDASAAPIAELTIRAGQTISANLVIERGETKGDISFGGDDSGRNLPHGCYVDNIGLSGLLIPDGQSIREFFITAAPWVPEATHVFHLRAKVDGNPTTLPVQIKVIR